MKGRVIDGNEPNGTSTGWFAYVGSYSEANGGESPAKAGIRVFALDSGSGSLSLLSATMPGMEAGYLCVSRDRRFLYAVDERKNDGRGPVGPAATVKAFAIDRQRGALTPINSQPAFGAFPTYVSMDPAGRWVVTASHGSFDHVERVIKTEHGFVIENVYDDSTVSLYPVAGDGALQPAADVQVLRGHGIDPCESKQAGGHPQASAHAHSAAFDPWGRFVIVCDKGADKIYSYPIDAASGRFGNPTVYSATAGSAPRHPAFHPTKPWVFVSNELASTVSCFAYNSADGSLLHVQTITATSPEYSGSNEPADIQVHPSGRFVFVNNRGEDSVVGFAVDQDTGKLRYLGCYRLAKSIHPGLAARSMQFDAAGRFMLVADRPANAVLTLAVNPDTGSLSLVATTSVPQPAFVLIVSMSP